jgi:hypothetical protein
MLGVWRDELVRQEATALFEHLDVPDGEVSVVGIAKLLYESTANVRQNRKKQGPSELRRAILEV